MGNSRLRDKFDCGSEVLIKFSGEHSEKFEITGILGEGGVSVVYKAKGSDGAEHRIKTFNPIYENYSGANKKETNYIKFCDTAKNRGECIPKDETNMIEGEICGTGYDDYNKVFVFDPMNDITLGQFIKGDDGRDMHRLVIIAMNILSFTSILRENDSVHFDIKTDNILVNELTGSFIGFIDFDSAFKFTSKGWGDYASFRPQISKPGISNIKELYYIYDIYCAIQWFTEIAEKNETFDKGGLEKTLGFVKDIENGLYREFRKPADSTEWENMLAIVKQEAEKCYTMIQGELSTVNVSGWAKLKFSCKHNYGYKRDLIGNIICDSITIRENEAVRPFDAERFCLGDRAARIGCSKQPAIIKCNYYEERKEICRALVGQINSITNENINLMAAPVKIDIAAKTVYDIRAEIAAQATEDGLFGTLCNTLSRENGRSKLVLVINIRTYSSETIRNLIECLNELRWRADLAERGRPYMVFNYIIVTGDIYEQNPGSVEFDCPILIDRMINPTGSIETYTYDFEHVKQLLESDHSERQLRGTLADLKKRGTEHLFASIYQLRKYSQKNPEEELSALNLVIDALDELSTEKAIAFIQVIYRAFSLADTQGGKGNRRVIAKSVDYHKPLEERDIVLIAERTGFINILGRGRPEGTLYVEWNPGMLREFLACAIYERYSLTNEGQYKLLFNDCPLDQSTNETLCRYLGDDKDALKKFNEHFDREDPIRNAWQYGYQNVGRTLCFFKKTELTREQTYYAINLRMIKKGLEGADYTEPTADTGHYVALNENAAGSYGDESKDIIGRISKNQSYYKWNRHTFWFLVAVLSVLVLSIIGIWLIIASNYDGSDSIEFDRSSHVTVLRNNQKTSNLFMVDAGNQLVFETDKIAVPLLNSKTTMERLLAFEFVDDDGKRYDAKAYAYQSGTLSELNKSNWTYWRYGLRNRDNDSITNNVILGFPEDALISAGAPIHITSVFNTIDSMQIDCDFCVIDSNEAVKVEVEQIPYMVSNEMECIFTFTTETLPLTTLPFSDSFFIGNGETKIAADYLEVMLESDNRLELLVGFRRDRPLFEALGDGSEETDDEDADILLDVLFDPFTAGIMYNNDYYFGISNVGYSIENDYVSDSGSNTPICVYSEKSVRYAPGSDIDAWAVRPEYSYHTESAYDARSIVLVPDDDSVLSDAYSMNGTFRNITNGAGLSGMSSYAVIVDADTVHNDSSFEFDVEKMFNQNGQSGSAHISAYVSKDKNENGTDITAPHIMPVNCNMNNDNIIIQLIEIDDYPMAATLDLPNPLPADILKVFGVKYDPNKVMANISYLSDSNGKIDTRSQRITITVPIEGYYGSKDDVSVVVDTSCFMDSKGNSCKSGVIVFGNEPYVSEPYYDRENFISVDLTSPYTTLYNLTSGHIGDVGSFTHEISSTTDQTTKIRFNGISDPDELHFTVNGGYYFSGDGSPANVLRYDFTSNFTVTYGKAFDGVVQAAIQLPFEADKVPLDWDLSGLRLTDSNGEYVSYERASVKCIGNTLVLTIEGVYRGKIPERIIFDEGLIRNSEDPSYHSGAYEKDIKPGTINN